MGADPRDTPRPPASLRLVTRLLIRGSDASYIVADLDASFARDVERGLGRGRATARYTRNVVGSVWSVWGNGLRGLVTHGIGLDAKLGLRMLVKQPLITAVAVFALGLGIPASLTILHGIDVIYSDLPVPDGDRVMGIRHYDTERHDPVLSSVDDHERWMDLTSFESVGAVRSYAVNVNPESGASPVRAAQITASSFDILRARPLLGRVLDGADEIDGAPDVVVIGESLWSARFARDPDIVGSTVRVGRTPHTVIGVMPADFRFPASNQVWLPFRARAADFPDGTAPLAYVFGRLAEGVSVEDAKVELVGLTERRAVDDPERFEHVVGEVVDMAILLLGEDDWVWRDQRDIVAVQGLIFALLLVVCGNVGTLILARTAARSAEITIRAALGAGRSRILLQLFVEALLLVSTATGFGLVCADAFAAWLMRLAEPSGLLPYWANLTLTPHIVMFALGLAVLCAVAAGVLPAFATTGRTIQAGLQNAAARGSSVRFGVGTSVLIVAEIVLSVGILAAGTARVRSVLVHHGVGLGFDPERYVVATLTLPDPDPLERPGTADSLAWALRVQQVQSALLTRLSEDPSVVGVGMSLDVPGLTTRNRTVILETPPADVDPIEWDVAIPRVDVSFFAGLHRPILAGRDFNVGDVEGPTGAYPTAVIVNESFVRDYLGGHSALGQRLRYAPQGTAWGQLDEGEWYEIVGVVGSFGTNAENPVRDAAIYHPLAPGELNPIHYAVEATSDPEALVPRLRETAASVDPEATVDASLLKATIRTESLFLRSVFLVILTLAAATFLLSATGLYALISFTISQRTREIGIRTALGARSSDIVAAVARRAAMQVGAGLALGVAFGWFLLDNQRNDRMFEVGSIPLTLALVATVAGAVCVLACAVPTLRGLRIQPTEALRQS